MHKLVIGCGYLGLRAARVWIARGDRVTALTRSAERAEQLRAEGIEPIVGDILNRDSLTSLAQLPKADTLLYAVGYDRRAGASRRDVYIAGLANVLSRMAGRASQMIYISSTSVYGQDTGEWVDESSPYEPATENGQVCLEAERTAQQHATECGGDPATSPRGGFSLNILRLAGIYGPDRLLQRVDALRRSDPLEGSPDAWLNLIHVEDAVAAIMACEERGRPGETYLVCDDQPVQRHEYYTLLASLVGAPAPHFDPTGSVEQTGVEQRRSTRFGKNKRCRNRKLRDELAVGLSFPTYATGLRQALAQSTLDGIGGEA